MTVSQRHDTAVKSFQSFNSNDIFQPVSKPLPKMFEFAFVYLSFIVLSLAGMSKSQKNQPTNTSDQGSSVSEMESVPLRQAHYAINPRETAMLALLEQRLNDELLLQISMHTTTSNPCTTKLNEYLSEYKQDNMRNPPASDTKANQEDFYDYGRSKAVAENPILIFKMIRRIFINLFKDIMNLCVVQEPMVSKIVKTAFQETEFPPVLVEDLQESMDTLIRIQYVYGIHAKDMQQGVFNGVHTNATLTFNDCIDLANHAIISNGHVLAYQWLQQAEILSNEQLSAGDKKHFEKSRNALMELYSVNSYENLERQLAGRVQETLMGYYDYVYYAPCRGEPLGYLPKSKSKLTCFYADGKWDPYFTYNHVKVERHSVEPSILQFYDFIGNHTINTIQSNTAWRLTRSRIGGLNNTEVHNNKRTAFATFLSEEESQYEVVSKLNKRVGKLVSLEVAKTGSSNFQIVQYGPGGHYDFHHDFVSAFIPV